MGSSYSFCFTSRPLPCGPPYTWFAFLGHWICFVRVSLKSFLKFIFILLLSMNWPDPDHYLEYSSCRLILFNPSHLSRMASFQFSGTPQFHSLPSPNLAKCTRKFDLFVFPPSFLYLCVVHVLGRFGISSKTPMTLMRPFFLASLVRYFVVVVLAVIDVIYCRHWVAVTLISPFKRSILLLANSIGLILPVRSSHLPWAHGISRVQYSTSSSRRLSISLALPFM